ncbi:MAG: hypothetical protein R3F24_07765 [Gammaproteobacteria bacterium]
MQAVLDLIKELINFPWMRTVVGVVVLLAVAWLAGRVVLRLLLKLVGGIARRTETHWDDALLDYRAFRWLARMVPALMVQYGIVLVPDVPASAEAMVGNVMTALVVFFLVMSVNAVLSAGEDIYQQSPRGQERSIRV